VQSWRHHRDRFVLPDPGHRPDRRDEVQLHRDRDQRRGGPSQPSQPTTKITPHVPSGQPPASDNLAGAQLISGASGIVTGINAGVTLGPGEPTIQDSRGGALVWYVWSVPVSGTYRFDRCSGTPGVAGLIGLFIGSSVASLTEFGAGPARTSARPGRRAPRSSLPCQPA
jgi:hypothetical protein